MPETEFDPEDIHDFTQAKFERNIPRFARGPVDVTWEVTNACNLRCRQCFLPDAGRPMPDELTLEEGYRLLDNLAEAGVKSLLFSGGEPLSRPDLEELATYASGRMKVWLQTNGWLLEEKAESLKKLGFEQVQVSLDGAVAETHDWFRGKGSFDRAVRGIRRCVELGFPSVGIAATISRRNIDEVPRMVDQALDMGVRAFETLSFMPSGRGATMSDMVLSTEQRSGLYRFLAEKQQQLESRMVVGSEEPFMYIKSKKLLDACAHPTSKAVGIGCGAGLLGCAVKPNGKVFPCVGVPVEIGDLRIERLKDVWRDSAVLKKLRNRREVKGKCGRCEYKFVCSGCRGAAYVATGDIMGGDPTCWHEPRLGG
ncbi:MAG: radical SAM protein [Dehalococcoidia bacterium]|nr:radical SAM protein [Dehalococcoidia bacterium]